MPSSCPDVSDVLSHLAPGLREVPMGSEFPEGLSAQLLHEHSPTESQGAEEGGDGVLRVLWVWMWVFYQVSLVDSLASSRARAFPVAPLKTDGGGSLRGMGCTVAVCEGTTP